MMERVEAVIMDLKPLFPNFEQMAESINGGIHIDQIVLSLPVKVSPGLEDQALIDLKQAYFFIVETSANSSATFKAYRNAIERLLLFLWMKREKSLKDIHKRDLLAYIDFIKNPDEDWVGLHCTREDDGKPNPNWRPFTIKPKKGETNEDIEHEYKISDSSIKSMLSRLSSFFSHLCIDDYLPLNPAQQIRSKRKSLGNTNDNSKDIRPVKRLTIRQMEYCLLSSDIMATENPEMHERTRFLMHFMLSTYVRISEVVPSERYTPLMGDIFRDQDSLWWFTVIGGKGNKNRIIPLSDDDMSNLTRYRESRNLSPYPAHKEQTPLIHRIRGKGQLSSSRSIRMIIQSCFERAKRMLMEDGHVADASTLNEATVHWLRHTGISEDLNANGRPLAHVAQDAGHTDVKTTSIYISSDLRDRHNSKKSKKPQLSH